MDLPSHELEAFRTLAQTLNFSQAAEKIHITQPALSQRIQNLEKALGLTLFLRDRKGARLTEAGLRLLRYCQIRDHLESELLSDLLKNPGERLGGKLRIAAYSSVLRSVIMPALAPLIRENPAIQFEFSMHEMADLQDVLERAQADFIVSDHVFERKNVQSLLIGEEKYVLIQSSSYPAREVYLDHDPEDRTTELFLNAQHIPAGNYSRSYVDDIEGILQGVALGLGQGVVPRHLIRQDPELRIVKGKKTMKVPVYLHYFKQSFYTSLQKAVIETLKLNCKNYF